MASKSRCWRYDKRSGTGAIAGQLYEVKMCCLLFLRGIRHGEFQLAANVDGAGAFDDVVLQLHSDDGPSNTMLIQLKHRENADLFRTKLLSPSPKHKFALLKYFLSYRDQILPEFRKRNDQNVRGYSLEELALVLYTNADITGLPEVSDHRDDLLSTRAGGGIFSFREGRDKDVWSLSRHVQGDISEYRTFLQRFKLYTRQAAEPELDALIKVELCDTLHIASEHSEALFPKLLCKIQAWWGSAEGEFLTESCTLWEETIAETVSMVNTPISGTIAQLGIAFNEDALAVLSAKLAGARVVLCRADGESPRLSLCKVVQALERGLRRFVLGHSDAALRFWQGPWCPLLALECPDPTPELLHTLTGALDLHPDKTLVVVVREKDLQAVRGLAPSGLVEFSDETNLLSLDKTSAQRVLAITVDFQGYPVHLGDLIIAHYETYKADRLKRNVEKVSVGLHSLHSKCIFTNIPTIRCLTLMGHILERQDFIEKEKNLKHTIQLDTIIDTLKNINKLRIILYYVIYTKTFVLENKGFLGKLRGVTVILAALQEDRELKKLINFDSVLHLIGEIVECRDPTKQHRNSVEVAGSNLLLQSVKAEKKLKIALESIINFQISVDLKNKIEMLRVELRSDIVTLERISNQAERMEVDDNSLMGLEEDSFELDLTCHEEELKPFLDLVMQLKFEATRLDVMIKEQEVKEAFTSDVLYTLVKRKCMHVGGALEEPMAYYIPRTLLRGGAVRPDSAGDLPGRVIVIAAEPGMGKSTLMTHIALRTKAKQPDTWVVKVNLNSMTSYLLRMETDKMAERSATQFLGASAGALTEFERTLLKFAINVTRRVVVFLDGFDEVCPRYQSSMINVLQEMQATNIQKILISSRQHLTRELESCTRSQAFSIDNFSEEDQRSFMCKVWRERVVGVDEAYLATYVDDVLRVMSQSLSGSGTDFLGIPLQAMLVVEVFEDDLKAGQREGRATPTQLDVIELYEHFFRKKCNVYLEEKQGVDLSKSSMLSEYEQKLNDIETIHEIAALMSYLPEEEHFELIDGKIMEEKKRNFVSEFEEKWAVIGIVTAIVEGRPVFVHRTVAECFIGKWLAKCYDRHKAFIRTYLYRSDYNIVKTFFDRNMAYGFELHSAVLNYDVEKVKQYLHTTSVNRVDKGGRTPLHIAATSSNVDNSSHMLEVLLQHGADINIRDEVLQFTPMQYADLCGNWGALDTMLQHEINPPKLNTLISDKAAVLMATCKRGYIQLLRYLFRKGMSMNTKLDEKATRPLHLACQYGQVRLVDYLLNTPRADMSALNVLLRKKLKLNAEDNDGRMAVHYVAIHGNVSNMKLLVEAGCMVNVCDNHNKSPLFFAVESGHLAIVEQLLQARCDVNTTNVHTTSPLHRAAQSGNTAMVRLLIEAGCNVNACNKYGITSLYRAAQNGHSDVVSLLITGGCDVNACDVNGMTPLHCASQKGHVQTARLLIEGHCDVDACDKNGITSLHRAAQNGYVHVGTLLIATQCDVEARDKFGITPLYRAAQIGHVDFVSLLVGARCDVNARDNKSVTPLHRAVQNGHLESVRLLTEAACDVDGLDGAGAAPLHRAAQKGHAGIARLLVGARCDVDARDGGNSTPLHYASMHGHSDIVKLLVDEHCNLDARDSLNRTAFDICNEYGHHLIADYLRQITEQ